MNGFANTILTFLLSWLRVLVNNIWRVLHSEDGGALYQFLCANWKAIVVILLVGGFVADRVIYLIRWRPYYVWSSKLGRLRRPRRKDAPSEADDAPKAPQYEPYAAEEAPDGLQTQVYAPPLSYAPETRVFAPVQAVPAYAPEPPAFSQPASQPEPPQATMHYAPMAQGAPVEHAPYARPYAAPENLEPVFDDEADGWDESDSLVQPPAWSQLSHGMEASFGTPQPEPLAYLRDMQAGFARPLPPEQLYAPPAPPQPTIKEEAANPSVHPGLDDAALRQNFGLEQQPLLDVSQSEDEWADGQPDAMPMMHAPTFHPFTAAREDAGAAQKGPGPLARFAKRARDLVGGEDEEHRPTIRDLQSTVDVTQAFREPVYPQTREQSDEE